MHIEISTRHIPDTFWHIVDVCQSACTDLPCQSSSNQNDTSPLSELQLLSNVTHQSVPHSFNWFLLHQVANYPIQYIHANSHFTFIPYFISFHCYNNHICIYFTLPIWKEKELKKHDKNTRQTDNDHTRWHLIWKDKIRHRSKHTLITMTDQRLCAHCQGMTCFPLRKHLGVLPTPTSDTFGILRTPTASEFWRQFGVLPIPSPFQQSPTLPHAPSTPTPRPTPSPMATLRPPPPPKETRRPLLIPHPPIWTPLQRSSETLWAIVEIRWLPQHPILRVRLLKQYTISRVDGGQDQWGMLGDGPDRRLV